MGATQQPATNGQAPEDQQGVTDPAGQQSGDPADQQPGDQPGTSPAEQASGQENGGQQESADLWQGIPDDHPIRKRVADLSAESAQRRVEARSLREAKEELESKIEGLKTPEEFAQAISEYQSKVAKAELEATKERVGRTYGLPDALVARLAGDTEEAIIEDAKALQALVTPNTPPPTPQGPPRGGLKPEQKAVSAKDVAAQIAKSRAGVTFQ